MLKRYDSSQIADLVKIDLCRKQLNRKRQAKRNSASSSSWKSVVPDLEAFSLGKNKTFTAKISTARDGNVIIVRF